MRAAGNCVGRRGGVSLRVMALASLVVFSAAAAKAQGTPPAPAQASPAAGGLPAIIDGKRVFAPSWFAADSPQTALDMVNRVPGFGIENGDDVRGFGAAAGNVVIDGARPTTKGQSLQSILERIQASAVERVELLEGSAAGALAPGKSQVVNVVRKASARSGGNYTVAARVHSNGFVRPEASASYTARMGAHSLTVSAGWEYDDYNNLVGFEGLQTPDGQFTERGPNLDQRRRREGQATIAFEGPLAGGTIKLNGRYAAAERTRDWEHVAFLTGQTRPFRRDEGEEGGRVDLWEIGGDWERALLGWTARFALLAKSTESTDTSEAGFNRIGAPLAFNRFIFGSVYDERIGRATAKRRFGAHQIEFGAEHALTSQDIESRFLTGDGTRFTLVPGAISATQVEERRTEAFISDSWTLSPRFTLDMTLTGEWSTISQSGDAAKERSFFYLKPKAVAVWKPVDGWTGKLDLERGVGQLDFGAFADSASVGDGNQNSGNPELRPEQVTRAVLTIERRWGGRGVFSASLTGEDFEDQLTLVPVGRGGVALGNVPEATRWGWDLNATIPLEKLVKGLEVSTSWRWRDSEITDPFTRQARPFSGWNGHNFEANFRHDIQSRKLRWGGWYWRGDQSYDFRPDQVFRWIPHDAWGLWVESRAIEGLSIEVGVDSPFGSAFSRKRFDFRPDRASGQLAQIQYRQREIDGGVYYVQVKGSF